MICKKVSYELAMEEWANLLDSDALPDGQRPIAKMHLAGLKAEKEMAYHLNAWLADNSELMVFNNLKIVHRDRAAQIDHLVLSRWAAYFIETKSASGKFNINDDGQWARVYGRKYVNIESPLEQSCRHEVILFDLLTARLPDFMGKFLGIQTTFRKLIETQHYVAVLPETNVTGKGESKIKSHIKKVDMLPRQVLAHHESIRSSLLGSVVAELGDKATTKRTPAFTKKAFEGCKELLLELDVSKTPLQQVHEHIAALPDEVVAVEDASDLPENSATTPPCPKCGEPMVLRTARKGERAGKPLYGCSRFPKCKGIINVE